MSFISQAKMYFRFANGLRSFTKETINLKQSISLIKQQMQHRAQNLLSLIDKGIYQNPRSPYLKLFKIAGCEYGDVTKMITDDGIDDALQKLCRDGIYFTIEEFKGKTVVKRGSVSFPVRECDFDNPYMVSYMQNTSSGSFSNGTRSLYDLDFLLNNIIVHNLPMMAAMNALELPVAIWMPAMPGVGPMNLLTYTKGGNIPVKWFSPLEKNGFKPSLKNRLATWYIINSAKLHGLSWPHPEFVPYQDSAVVAEWLASACRTHGGAILDSYTSAAVRVCQAAQEKGLDISKARFIIGGEPVTETKLREITATGAQASVLYATSEAGFIATACLTPEASDDVHLFEDSFAIIQRKRTVPRADTTVSALLISSLIPSAPKVLLNVETGDSGVVTKRICSCPIAELGYHTHLHHIRGFDRFTSEGMNFLGSELLRIIEEVLPQRFGGAAYDYQIIEDESPNGQSRISILVNPTVLEFENVKMVNTVLHELARTKNSGRMMASLWAKTNTITVRREQPHSQRSGKLLPLQIKQPKDS